MSKFALITHLLSLDSETRYLFYPQLRFLEKIFSKYQIKKILKNLPPYKMSYVKKMISITNNESSGWVIVCPLLPEHFVTLKEEFVINKIASCCKMAKKLGADIAGLAAFTSIVGNEGKDVSQKVNLAITNGNTFTAYLAIDSILKAAECLNRALIDSALCIIGASGDIGSICTKVLSKKFKKTILVSRDKNKLINLAEIVTRENKIKELIIETNIKQAIQRADFILCAASSILPLFETRDIKRGTVVCDVSIPPSIIKNNETFREDVLIFDGGKAKVNFKNPIVNREWQILFPDNVIYGCFAETILLALEGQIENYSIGRGKITEAKIDDIASKAKKYGFETSPFKFGEYAYTEEDINRIRLINKFQSYK